MPTLKARFLFQAFLGLLLCAVNCVASGQVLVYDSSMNFKCSYELIGDYDTIVELWLDNMPEGYSNRPIQKKVYQARYLDENGDGTLYEDGVARVKFFEKARQHWVHCQITMPPIYRADGSVAMREWVMISDGVYEQTIVASGRKYNVYSNDFGSADKIFVPVSR